MISEVLLPATLRAEAKGALLGEQVKYSQDWSVLLEWISVHTAPRLRDQNGCTTHLVKQASAYEINRKNERKPIGNCM